LKAGWLVKHRRHRPALALVFLDREDVEGDPNRWISLSAALDAARAAAEAADCKLAVVVVDEAAETRGVIPDDRCDAVRRRLKIDPRALMTMSLPPTPDAVKALASLCKALTAEHYAKEASLRASRTHVEDDALGSVANPAFKAGAFSEFRGDWAGAARWYARAHQALVAAHGDERRAPKPPANESNQSNAPIDAFRVQRRRAALLAAANASYKTCALSLMLDPDAPRDAVAHFQAHAAAFKKPPTWLPREYLPEHHAWLASQYAAFGRLLASRVAWGGDADPASGRPFAPPPAGTPRTYLPGFYFHAAANAAEARRRSLEAAMDASEATTSASAAATPAVVLRPGPREGTLVNAATGAPVPDAAFLRHTLSNAKETFAALPAARVRLLAEAREHYKRALAFDETPKHARLFASLASQLASATLAAGDVAAAERLFEAAAAVYRREGWDDLLGVTLMALKECYRRVPDARKKRAHLETCLELAALGAGNGAVLASGHGAFDPDAAAHAARAAMTETGAAVDDNVVAGRRRCARRSARQRRRSRVPVRRRVPDEPSRPRRANAVHRGAKMGSAFRSKSSVGRGGVLRPFVRVAARRGGTRLVPPGHELGRPGGAETESVAPRRCGRHAQVGTPRARDGGGGDPRDRDRVPSRA
jgi:tetratricopeptide (TPR) repeat protein